jgi:hypothetical protein
MKPTAYLVNISRGGVVDQDALVEALRARRIAGAGLDVFSPEPLPPGHPLTTLDNVVLTPHLGAGTLDAFRTKMRFAFENMRRVVRGEPPLERVPRHLTLVYRRYALVGSETAGLGLAIGAVMFGGAYAGRRILDRMSDRAFVTLVEVLITALGLLFILYPAR